MQGAYSLKRYSCIWLLILLGQVRAQPDGVHTITGRWEFVSASVSCTTNLTVNGSVVYHHDTTFSVDGDESARIASAFDVSPDGTIEYISRSTGAEVACTTQHRGHVLDWGARGGRVQIDTIMSQCDSSSVSDDKVGEDYTVHLAENGQLILESSRTGQPKALDDKFQQLRTVVVMRRFARCD